MKKPTKTNMVKKTRSVGWSEIQLLPCLGAWGPTHTKIDMGVREYLGRRGN